LLRLGVQRLRLAASRRWPISISSTPAPSQGIESLPAVVSNDAANATATRLGRG